MILDFGLITEFSPDMLGGAEHVIGGTPAYISPEESFGEPPSEAGDWYSVGATIYEALTGRIPFTGPAIEVLLQQEGMRSPASCATGTGGACGSQLNLHGAAVPRSGAPAIRP